MEAKINNPKRATGKLKFILRNKYPRLISLLKKIKL